MSVQPSGQTAGGGPVKASGLYCPFCSEVTKYEKLAKVGQGTFG